MMPTRGFVLLIALAVLGSAAADADAQKADKLSAGAKQAALSLNGADQGKNVHAKVGQEIVVTLQTVGPGQYETPKISSSCVRFEGSYFPRDQIPAGPRQVYRFIAVAVGEARVEISHSQRNTVFQITVHVKPE